MYPTRSFPSSPFSVSQIPVKAAADVARRVKSLEMMLLVTLQLLFAICASIWALCLRRMCDEYQFVRGANRMSRFARLRGRRVCSQLPGSVCVPRRRADAYGPGLAAANARLQAIATAGNAVQSLCSLRPEAQRSTTRPGLGNIIVWNWHRKPRARVVR